MVSLVSRISSFMRLERFRRFFPVGFVDAVYVEQSGRSATAVVATVLTTAIW